MPDQQDCFGDRWEEANMATAWWAFNTHFRYYRTAAVNWAYLPWAGMVSEFQPQTLARDVPRV